MTMEYRFTELVDIDAFRALLKSFYEATGILHGLVDADNQVISAIGWQEACTLFHRANPASNACCLESNRYLAEHLREGSYVGFACKNGLMDYATPIVVDGRQLATLYFGQLLHEPPDLDFFRRQAAEYGFDEDAYLAAIRKVPVIARERIEPIMSFYVQLAQMLARSGFNSLRAREAELRLAELNRDLAERVEERTAELREKNRQLTFEVRERQAAEEALHDSRAQLQAILDSSPIGIGWSEHDGRVSYVNSKFTELFGYTLEDVPTVEEWFRRAFSGEVWDMVAERWARRIATLPEQTERTPVLELPVNCKDGTVRHVIVALSWVGERHLACFSDISDRWLAEQRDHARNATLEMIAKGAPLGQILEAIVRSVEAEDATSICSILLVDRDGRRLRTGAAPNLPDFYNQAVDGMRIRDGAGSCGTTAHTGRRVVVADIASHPYWQKFKDVASRAGLSSCWSEPILSSQGRVIGTFAIYHRTPCTPGDSALQLIGYAANLASIAIEHRRALEELERQAHTDSLTGLANRRHFLALAEVELARALRYGKALSLFMLDVDHFKAVNDTHGHNTGDIVLQSLAEKVTQTLRKVDAVGRLGGEEFAAILPESNLDEARVVAERLRAVIASTTMQTENGAPVTITVSIGVATLAGDSDSIDTLLKRADDALYLAKKSGRNQVRACERL